MSTMATKSRDNNNNGQYTVVRLKSDEGSAHLHPCLKSRFRMSINAYTTRKDLFGRASVCTNREGGFAKFEGGQESNKSVPIADEDASVA